MTTTYTEYDGTALLAVEKALNDSSGNKINQWGDMGTKQGFPEEASGATAILDQDFFNLDLQGQQKVWKAIADRARKIDKPPENIFDFDAFGGDVGGGGGGGVGGLQKFSGTGTTTGPMGRLYPISGDEVLNCIRVVQRELDVNPEMWQQLLRLAFTRAKIVNAFARQVYPDYPTLLEWSMLRKMMHNWHFPISCLEQNPGAIRGEPKYKPKCFRPGTILPGSQTNKLYVATGAVRVAGREPHATGWLMLRDTDYTATGCKFAKKMEADLKDQYWDRQLWDSAGQSMQKMYELSTPEKENLKTYQEYMKTGKRKLYVAGKEVADLPDDAPPRGYTPYAI